MASLGRARRSASPSRVFAGAPREISLVGSAMGAGAGDGPRCVHCHRTPLVGEVVHVYLRGSDAMRAQDPPSHLASGPHAEGRRV